MKVTWPAGDVLSVGAAFVAAMFISGCSGIAKTESSDPRNKISPFARFADDPLVDLSVYDPRIRLDIRYATSNNFLGRPVYTEPRCFLRRRVAERLRAVQDQLTASGLGLVVFDGYRPVEVQREMWRILPDPKYVADPAKGSRHNRGAAVDLALVDADGTLLAMPTEFDDFTPAAHRDAAVEDPVAYGNRERLTKVMLQHGFVGLETEWWHFDIENWEDFPIIRDETKAAILKALANDG